MKKRKWLVRWDISKLLLSYSVYAVVNTVEKMLRRWRTPKLPQRQLQWWCIRNSKLVDLRDKGGSNKEKFPESKKS